MPLHLRPLHDCAHNQSRYNRLQVPALRQSKASVTDHAMSMILQNARLRFVSADAQENVQSLDLYLQFPQLDSRYAAKETCKNVEPSTKACRCFIYLGNRPNLTHLPSSPLVVLVSTISGVESDSGSKSIFVAD